ncbi:MAG: dephospho-CoA kinase [Acidobacteria bacterium]|nr:dephospho-CoA kinase [Acidobacteriota bacterium]
MSATSGSAPPAYRVGLTGGLASGKSTVAGWLRDAGFQVIDADRLVAELYRPGAAGAAAARRLFGEGVLTPQGGVDHAALAARVFSDPAARRALEQAIHPLVRRRFEEIAAAAAAAAVPHRPGPGAAAETPQAPSGAGAEPLPPATMIPAAPATPPVLVLEATLLVEAGYGPGFDLIVTVEGDPEGRLRRAVARGLDPAAARARLAAQGDGAGRRRGAHRVIENDGTLAELRGQVDALVADVRRAAVVKAAASPRGPSPPPASRR